MKSNDWLQILILFGALATLTPLLGRYIYRVLHGEGTWLSPLLAPLERLIYRLAGIDPQREMAWPAYCGALLVFNALGIIVLLGLLRAQSSLPLNPQAAEDIPWALALNTAVSFVTNTNWQAYAGEKAMSYLTQMAGLAVQNFTSAATGIATVAALMRGLTRRSGATLGNFWADLVRSTLYVLLPGSLLLAIVLAQQGVPQTFAPAATVQTLEGARQIIPLGPAASQIAIKQLGTNGGGYYGANSAHPLENPTPLTNFLQMLAIFAVPSALTCTLGLMARDLRQGWTIFGAMAALFVAGFALAWWAEAQANPALGVAQQLEGKEMRFGVMNSSLFATMTTAASCGAVNAMHDSLSPLAGGVALVNMLLGEVIFGGVGAGLYGMLVFVIITVFLAGLMVGRTPEYLGRKIEAREVRWAVVAILGPSVCILLGTALAAVVPAGSATLGNPGAHGFTEVFYAFASAAANNGSALGGLDATSDFYNYALAACMLAGRFVVIVPVLAIAGSMVGKKIAPPSPGTFPTDGPTFALLLIAVVLVVGGLNFFPALTLGPVVEQLRVMSGRTF